MLISELSFPHLQAAHEEQLTRDLERRRIVQERLADVSEHPMRHRRADRRVRRGLVPAAATAAVVSVTASADARERIPRRGLESSGTPVTDPCPV
jgi:hypothetical protein